MSSLQEAGLFPRIVEDVREAALTASEIADIAGVDERQVYNWASGASRPRGEKRNRLLEIHYIVQQLREVYSPEGTEIWLHGRNRALHGEKPIELLKKGDFETVLRSVEQLTTGAT
jgi:hypothetical protein